MDCGRTAATPCSWALCLRVRESSFLLCAMQAAHSCLCSPCLSFVLHVLLPPTTHHPFPQAFVLGGLACTPLLSLPLAPACAPFSSPGDHIVSVRSGDLTVANSFSAPVSTRFTIIALSGSTLLFSDLEDGPHSLRVQAREVSGDAEKLPKSLHWTVDTTPPVLSVARSGSAFIAQRYFTVLAACGGEAYVGNCSLCWAVVSSSSGSSVEACQAAGASGLGVGSGAPLYDEINVTAPASDGEFQVLVTATDVAGNPSATQRFVHALLPACACFVACFLLVCAYSVARLCMLCCLPVHALLHALLPVCACLRVAGGRTHLTPCRL